MVDVRLQAKILTSLLIFGILLTGCKMDESAEPTYTVWTDSVSYSNYSATFGVLNDGYYEKYELTNSEFNSMSLSNEYKHSWTEDQIYNWFIGRDFISSEANQLKSWLLTSSHCFLGSRSGGTVYIIIK